MDSLANDEWLQPTYFPEMTGTPKPKSLEELFPKQSEQVCNPLAKYTPTESPPTYVGSQGVQGGNGPQGVQGGNGPQGVQGILPLLPLLPPSIPPSTNGENARINYQGNNNNTDTEDYEHYPPLDPAYRRKVQEIEEYGLKFAADGKLKKPKSAFFFFMGDMRERILDVYRKMEKLGRWQNGNNPPELPKLPFLYQEWHKLSIEVQNKYKNMAKIAKNKYDEYVAKYYPRGGEHLPSRETAPLAFVPPPAKRYHNFSYEDLGEDETGPRRPMRWGKIDPLNPKRHRPNHGPGGEKRCLNGYMVFANYHRQEIANERPELKITDIGIIMGDMWNNLTDQQKEKYNLEAKENRDRLGNGNPFHRANRKLKEETDATTGSQDSEEYSGGNPSETEIVHVAPGDLPQTYTQFTKANRDMIRQREREAAVINLDANTLNIPSTNGATQINIVSSGLREGQITQYMPDPMDLDGDGEGEGLEIGGLKKITRA